MYNILKSKIFILINLFIWHNLSATNNDHFFCCSNDKPKLITITSANDLIFKDQGNNLISFKAHGVMGLYPNGEIKLIANPQYSLVGWNSSVHSPERLEVVKLEARLTQILRENDAWFVVLKDGQLKIPSEFNHEYVQFPNGEIVKEKKKRIKGSELYLNWFLPLPNQLSDIAHYYKESMKRKILAFIVPAGESNE
jgi:hypothetical protein